MSIYVIAEVWKLELRPAQMLVAIALADHAGNDGEAIFPSLARIAWKCGYDERQVRRVVRGLEESGLLVKVAEARGVRPTEYRLDLAAGKLKRDWKVVQEELREAKRLKRAGKTPARPDGHDVRPTEVQDVRPRTDIDNTAGGHSEPTRADPAPPEPSVDPSVESSVQPSLPSPAEVAAPDAATSSAPAEVEDVAPAALSALAVDQGWVGQEDHLVAQQNGDDRWAAWRTEHPEGKPLDAWKIFQAELAAKEAA